MSVSQEFLEHLTDIFSPLGHLRIQRMFGGALIKIDEQQLGVVIEEQLYFKLVDEALMASYQAEGSEQFTYRRKDKPDPVVIKHWWRVPEELLDEPNELCERGAAVLAQFQ